MEQPQERPARKLHNTALRDKLRQTMEKKEYRGPKPAMNIMGNVNRIGEEGTNHILLAAGSIDPVGKILAIDSEEPLYHDKLGYFRTFQGFWHYISTEERDDRLRELDGTKLENLVKNLTKVRIQNFNALILDALYQRAIKKKESVFLIKRSVLPFDHYRIFNTETGLRQRMGFSFWLIEGCEIIRTAIKTDAVPDFTHFMNTRRTPLADFIQKEFFDFIPPKPVVKVEEQTPATPVASELTDEENSKAASPTLASVLVVEIPALENADISSGHLQNDLLELPTEMKVNSEVDDERMDADDQHLQEVDTTIAAEQSAEHPVHHSTHHHHG